MDSERSRSHIANLDHSRLLEAYAKSLTVFYAAERAFQADPNLSTAHAYDTALIRLTNLRVAYRQGNQLGDAIAATEADESVGR